MEKLKINKQRRYKYYISEENRKVIAISTFAKKPVRGVAVCYDSDEFSIEEGKKIAKLKCDIEIEKRRLKYARQRLLDASIALNNIRSEFADAEAYLDNSEITLSILEKEYSNLCGNE